MTDQQISRRYYQRMIDAGICVKCKRLLPSGETMRRCEGCRASEAAWQAGHRRKQNGGLQEHR